MVRDFFVFFFSSRRRHTRYWRDWSSDVCSSDLRRALEKADSSNCRLRLPVDVVIGDRFDASAEHRELDGVNVPEDWMGLDIGPRTAAAYADEVAKAGTVFWNGPMGAFELKPFAAGTRAV